MPRCYVPGAHAGGRIALSDTEAHHVARVLRLRVGAAVVAFDGRGHEWDARIHVVVRDGVTLDIGPPRTPAAEPAVAVTLAVAILKGDQMDAVVRDATVLGVRAIQPTATEHVTVPSRAWARDGIDERWARVAIAAAKQCGRAVVPEVAPVRPLADVWRASADARRLVCIEPAQGGEADELGPPASTAVVFVGPEGGWSRDELAMFTAGEMRRVTLGPRTLRAELAPVVALTTLWARWGW